MKRNIVFLLLTFGCAFWPKLCLGYDVATHYIIARASFGQSNLSMPDVLDKHLGLKPLAQQQQFPTTPADLFNGSDEFSKNADLPCSHSTSETAMRLVSCGAMFEDVPGPRVLNHFFDPAHGGRPLSVTALVGPASTFPPPLLFITFPSPDWALGGQVGIDLLQDFSYSKARGSFFTALTEPDNNLRKAAWGKTFQSLGQVIHHLADMGQPQHVRNDPHLELLNGFLNDANVGVVNHASRYERYAAGKSGLAKVGDLLAAGAVPVYPLYSGNFSVARRFWVGDGKGIAEFTNSNFVSYGTNFVWQVGQPVPHPDFPAGPVPSAPHDESMASLFNGAAPTKSIDDLCNDHINPPSVYLDHCFMTFYSSDVFDALTGIHSLNTRASTYSIFDEDLDLYNQTVYIPDPSFVVDPSGPPPPYTLPTIPTKKIFALNRFNFDTALNFLIPRTAGYGAGLINYFFRGQMQIAPPPEGVYGIIDTSTCFTSTCGFGKIKLLLKNTTPNDDMGAGILRAVAKYHLNTCYQPDLSGEYGGASGVFRGNGCRSPDEYIAVSNPISVDPSGPVSIGRDFGSQAIAFMFSQPIPINASDLFLQVVFRGKLGQEDDAVAVTTENIAEPNFLAFENWTDYAYDAYHQEYLSDATAGEAPRVFPNFTVAFGSNEATISPTAIASLTSLGGGEHAQLALLMDRGQNSISMTWQHGWTADDWIPDGSVWPWLVEEFTMDDTGPYADQYIRSCPVFLSRGGYRDTNWFFLHYTGGTHAKSAMTNSGLVRPKATPAAGCGVPTTGIYRFSDMTPFNPAAAKSWQINF